MSKAPTRSRTKPAAKPKAAVKRKNGAKAKAQATTARTIKVDALARVGQRLNGREDMPVLLPVEIGRVE